MCDFLTSDVWLLLILAAVLAVLLICSQTSAKSEKLAAFFNVLGDSMALLSLHCDSNA